MNRIQQIYKKLLKTYGAQGWWPLIKHKGCNPTKTGCVKGYHPNDYSFPRDAFERFEICIGAILTQNTSWPAVEKALINLDKLDLIDPKKLLKTNAEIVKTAIKPAGYYNQKYEYLKEFSSFYLTLKGRAPSRQELLEVKGIGKETADSMLLYAYRACSFVVDAYTKRIFLHLGLIDDKMGYDDIKQLFEQNLYNDLIVYQEYHALLVEHAKRCYSKKPYDDKVLS